jgi:hypothetical protein
MRLLLFCLFFMSLTPAMAAEPITILEVKEQHNGIIASFSLTGNTLTRDPEDHPQVSSVDRLQGELTVESPEAYVMQLPVFSGAAFGDFTLVERGKTSRFRTGDIISRTSSWLIEPYNPGEYTLPALIITGTAQNGAVETFTLNLPAVHVRDLDAADQDFDILPPRQITENNPWLLILTAIVIVALLILLVIWLKGQKRERPLSPKQLARARLHGLQGDSKEKAMHLSAIIRQFLDANFNLCTNEKTYKEYEPFITNHPHIHEADIILAILKSCDHSNYSNTPLSAESMAELIQQALDYIEDCAEPLRPGEDTKTCGRW